MLLTDPDMLEKSLHNDLNILIKNIKIREEQYHKLLDWTKAIITHQQDITSNSNILLTDQINRFNTLLSHLKKQNKQLLQEQQDISNKYKGIIVNDQPILRLMGRVGARMLEMFQSYFEKLKVLCHNVEQKYKKMKKLVMKALNQRDITNFIAAILQYMINKLNQAIYQIEQRINILQNGQPQKIQQYYHKISKSPQKKRQHQLSMQAKRQKEKEKEKERQKEKIKQKILQMKQAKNNEKIKKQKTKLANHMLNNLYSTMDLVKNNLFEDIVCLNNNEKSKRLYAQILMRNRFNHEQIMAFSAKSQDFSEKVRRFKEVMETESKKIQALIFKNIQKKQTFLLPTIQNSNSVSQLAENHSKKQQTLSDYVSHDLEVIPLVAQDYLTKKSETKISSATKYKVSQLCEIQLAHQNFEHIRFDVYPQQTYLRSNRARLPQISSNKITGQNNFKKIIKNQERISIITTNLNINSQPNKKRFSSKIQKIQNFIEKTNISKQKKKESLPKQFQYTFYSKKINNKFYQTPNNYIM